MTTKTKNTLRNAIQAYNKYLKDPFKVGGIVSFKLKNNSYLGPLMAETSKINNDTLRNEIVSKIIWGNYYLYNLNQGKIIATYEKEVDEPIYLVRYKGSNGRFAVYPFFKKNLKAYKDNEQPK